VLERVAVTGSVDKVMVGVKEPFGEYFRHIDDNNLSLD
jgi:hypothetical protein